MSEMYAYRAYISRRAEYAYVYTCLRPLTLSSGSRPIDNPSTPVLAETPKKTPCRRRYPLSRTVAIISSIERHHADDAGPMGVHRLDVPRCSESGGLRHDCPF